MNTKEQFQKQLGINLRKVRNEKLLTVEKLALEAGIAYSQISRIELGKRNPSGYTLYILSQTLDVCPSKLFELSSEKEKIGDFIANCQ
jgi:transcriptional regulator with XRE-family HTH domain